MISGYERLLFINFILEQEKHEVKRTGPGCARIILPACTPHWQDVNLALKPVLVKNKADWMMAQQESFKRAV
ncbi:hypothetical protein RRG08_009047, partial [Elysia crispata]